MFVLPVSGWRVGLPALTGRQESVLLDTASMPEASALLIMLPDLAVAEGGAEWGRLPLSDADFLLLRLRQAAIGDRLNAEARCGCGSRLEIGFGISDYLRHHAPAKPKFAAPDDGWWRMGEVRFRPPTLGDAVDALESSDPAKFLMGRCVEGRSSAKVEAELERIAPGMDSDLASVCPDCGASIQLAFEPRSFVLREMREQAAFLDDDVHLLASAYHWSLEEILALSRRRRIQFAERVRQDRVEGVA